ncbi:MAG: hypothetical protein Q9212_000227 [Teloschistes hypoglaucus]
MSLSPRQRGRKRYPRAQPSQGDAVLIGFLAGQNHPDIATTAGEVTLNSASQSEAGELSQGMDPEDEGSAEQKNHLVQTAQDALSKGANAPAESSRRIRPKITTQSLAPTAKEYGKRAQSRSSLSQEHLNSSPAVDPEKLDPALGGKGSETLLDEEEPGRSFDVNHASSLATSPRLRQFMASKGSEILPAIQSATPSLSSKTPNGQQSLPSISAQLGGLVDGPSPNDSLPSRSTFPMTAANGIQSPPMSGISPRLNQYPSPQARLNTFPNPYSATQPSPASTYNEVSPREPYRLSHDPTSMSPPGKPGPPYYNTGRTPQSDELTPQSAESYTGFKGFAGAISPNGDPSTIETGRMLPPLPGTGPLATANYKCDYPSCTAPPFQTQYLLKYAHVAPYVLHSDDSLLTDQYSSHANVHSQVRPHYCPVKSCPRSENGKGFKRKNEMIRHGLVHQSPGYVCPFCPEREHKYPRPDNLQRHVRGNHTDKDMNDPKLRDVLAQRTEGGTRGRRRRFGG